MIYRRERVSLKTVLSLLEDSDLNVYYKEITTPDISGTGIRVVRVVVPGLVELNSSHILPRKNARRLHDVPGKLGIKSFKGITNIPHPFP